MAGSTSSCSPSSSAVTIPIPGKSILKRPPPAHSSLFSRITRFLPTSQQVQSGDDEKPLKRAHFILPEIAIVYPISSVNPPSTPTLKEEKRAIEDREAERRRRVVRGNSTTDEWWSMDKVESFYRECCAGCDEDPDPAITVALKHASPTTPRTVDFSGVQLTVTSASILSDVFSIEWGLRKLVFRECDLDEQTLKPILHALLIPNSLSFLSVASNRRLKTPAFRLIGAYATKATSLQFLDLSQNNLDKKSVEYIVAALTSEPGLASLRLDDCALRPPALETLSRAVRISSLRNISLRHNRINATGAVALALMIRDYPDVVPASLSLPLTPSLSTFSPSPYSSFSPGPSPYLTSSATSLNSPTTSYASLSPTQSFASPGPGTPTSSNSVASSPSSSVVNLGESTTPTPTSALHPPHNHAHIAYQNPPNSAPPHTAIQILPPPPPRHPNSLPLQTTYTPYVPRARRRPAGAPTPRTPTASQLSKADKVNPLSPSGHPIPIITSSAQGGITTRHPVTPGSAAIQGYGNTPNGVHGSGNNGGTGSLAKHELGPSAALLDKVRALDALPRVGALRTLDLKGNDLRTGITYIAQVLKRNRTLKVLNLSENKLDVAGLVSIAEALKYNSCLETLDLSKNPCSGPALEGIQSLRTAFTLNTALKRLFLSQTAMTSAGAIALAEFLPESTSLLHLDLTGNKLDLAGVMALSRGLRGNGVMRCLDLEVPPGEEEFARMCRDILNTCVRNTEAAERSSQAAVAATASMNGDSGSNASSTENVNGGPTNGGASGRGQGKGVWGMIEESELARSIRLGEEKKTDGVDILTRAKNSVKQLTELISSSQASLTRATTPTTSTPNAGSPTPTKASPPRLKLDLKPPAIPNEAQPLTKGEILQAAKDVTNELAEVITKTDDPISMEQLLDLNDQITALVRDVEKLSSSTTDAGANGRPVLTLHGLGLGLPTGPANSANGTAPNGISEERTGTMMEGEEEEDIVTPTTPRIDKGKGRAEPEPEEPEKVLSPTAAFLLADEDEEDEDDEERHLRNLAFTGGEDREGMRVRSPTDRSRIWMEEEGEVFRKGQILLGPEEMEGEYAGEELRKELLEAMVERPPPRPLTDEFGLEIPPPLSPSSHSPIAEHIRDKEHSPASPTESKPSPRPYISRSRSSSNNSILSVISPSLPAAEAAAGTEGGRGSPVGGVLKPSFSRRGSIPQ
ncbi:hypothetical protein Hypma_002780 [Hypsizygus marmoreus]|uniref:RNI-like protein n=1 Tax=Hypsizygus marmoreus TaxID=39966 RepID=A0A369J5M6_HYPMA|nr:hypothetical protein Hypma_002780 [Hypsizygus marmoreus]